MEAPEPPATPPPARSVEIEGGRGGEGDRTAVATASPVFRSPGAEGTDGHSATGTQPLLEPEPAPFDESEDDDNEPPLFPERQREEGREAERETGVAALRAAEHPARAGGDEWFCHQCSQVIPVPNDPGNPQCGGCGGYFVEMRPVMPSAPAAFPFAGRRRHHAAHRGGRGFDDDDDDEDFADGLSGLLRGGTPVRRRPLTDDERMERLLVAVSPVAREYRRKIARVQLTHAYGCFLVQLLGTSAQRRAEGGARARPGEFDVEQLLSLFVQRAIRLQGAEGGVPPPPPGGTTPTSRRAIDSLSAVTADDSHAGESCTICFDQFEAGSSEILALPCEHFFCKACILPWLEKTNSCPVCRHELEAEEPADSPPLPASHSVQWENDNPLAMAARADLMERERRGLSPPRRLPMAARVRAGGPGRQEGIVVFPFDDGRESCRAKTVAVRHHSRVHHCKRSVCHAQGEAVR